MSTSYSYRDTYENRQNQPKYLSRSKVGQLSYQSFTSVQNNRSRDSLTVEHLLEKQIENSLISLQKVNRMQNTVQHNYIKTKEELASLKLEFNADLNEKEFFHNKARIELHEKQKKLILVILNLTFLKRKNLK